MKLAVHQMSYSGLGTKAGGPIGGKKQSSDYGVGCRWSPDSLSKKVLKYSDLLGTTRFSRGFCADFEPFFYAAMSYAYTEKNPYPFMYLDPPYYVKGSELYAQSFSVGDHVKLSEKLKLYKFPWLLSYDDCPEIRELYNWASIEEISVNYTIRTARAKNELLIFQK
jgi:DNA adenine methylase